VGSSDHIVSFFLHHLLIFQLQLEEELRVVDEKKGKILNI